MKIAKKLLAACALTLLAAAAQAQAWPAKPVTLLVPFPPGGASDMVARTLGTRLQERFNQTFMVDNRAGATGTIGAAQVKRAAPDGQTFLVTSLGPLVIAPHLMKAVPYDAAKDFDHISVLVQAPNVLVVPANSPHKSLADVLSFLKAHPDRMTFASSGNGSSDHLTAELFWLQTGTSGTHVPYKGGGPAISDLLGGQVDAGFMNINSVLSHINAGKLKVLAITGEKRSPVLPNVPTLSESGVKAPTCSPGRRSRRRRACRPTSAPGCTRAWSRRSTTPRSASSSPRWASRSSPTRPSSSPPTSSARAPAGSS